MGQVILPLDALIDTDLDQVQEQGRMDTWLELEPAPGMPAAWSNLGFIHVIVEKVFLSESEHKST